MGALRAASTNQRGAALLVAVIVILMVTALSAVFLRMAYNMKILMYGISGGRTYAYYRAQAGIIDAQYRLRTNFLTGLTSPPANGFLDPTYAPTYFISLTLGYGGAQTTYTPGSTRVQISAAAGNSPNGVRTITALGREYDR